MKNLKTGFTLVELMVFFMFISLFLMASAPMMHTLQGSCSTGAASFASNIDNAKNAKSFFKSLGIPTGFANSDLSTQEPGSSIDDGKDIGPDQWQVNPGGGAANGNGGSGESVPETPTTSDTNTDEGKPSCSWVEAQIELIKTKIKENYLDCMAPSSSHQLLMWCHGVADSYLEEIIKKELLDPVFSKYNKYGKDGKNYAVMTSWLMGSNSEDVGKGGPGGAGKTLYYQGTFRFHILRNVPYDQTVEYLSNLLTNSIQTGSTNVAGSCSGWRREAPENGTDGESKVFAKDPDTSSTTVTAGDGTGVTSFAAIKVISDDGKTTCYTNWRRAGGGGGGHVTSSPGKVMGTFTGTIGAPADGVTPSLYGTLNPVKITEDNLPDLLPIIKVVTNLSQRNHRVGASGTSAQPAKVYYAPVLNDCQINVAEGGSPIDSTFTTEQIANYQSQLNTTLSCNSNSLNLVAEGGTYRPTTIVVSHSGFEKVNGNGQFVNLDQPWYSSDVEPPAISIDDSNVFTKFIMAIASRVGAGGRGNTVTDKCTQPYGDYQMQLWYNGVMEPNPTEYKLPLVPCDKVENVKVGDALPGTGGAVVISW